MSKALLEFPQLLHRQPWRAHEVQHLTLRLAHPHRLLGHPIRNLRRDDEHPVDVAVQQIAR